MAFSLGVLGRQDLVQAKFVDARVTPLGRPLHQRRRLPESACRPGIARLSTDGLDARGGGWVTSNFVVSFTFGCRNCEAHLQILNCRPRKQYAPCGDERHTFPIAREAFTNLPEGSRIGGRRQKVPFHSMANGSAPDWNGRLRATPCERRSAMVSKYLEARVL